jgi:hypothetical protein
MMYIPKVGEFVVNKTKLSHYLFDQYYDLQPGLIFKVQSVDPYDDNECEVICYFPAKNLNYDSSGFRPATEEEIAEYPRYENAYERMVVTAREDYEVRRDMKEKAELKRLIAKYGIPEEE